MNRTNHKQTTSAAAANNAVAGLPQKSMTSTQLASRQQQQSGSRQSSSAAAARQLANAGANAKFTPQTVGNISQQQQQHKVTNTALPIINAPTSLTNLAQLSGITLLPIGNTNKPQNINLISTTMQPRASSSTAQTNTPQQQQQQQQQSSRQKVSGHNQSTATIQPNANHHQQKLIKINSQQPVYNLSSITSLQLLNQSSNYVSGDTMTNNWVNTTLNHEPDRQVKTKTQPKPKLNARANNSRKTKTQGNLNLNSDIQVIPVTDGLPPMFGEISDLPPTQSSCSYDDLLSQPSIEPMDSCVDVNGDLNNISLIKLMAILNNPALTITAVNPNKSPIQPNHAYSPPNDIDQLQHHQQSSQAALNQMNNRQINITMPNNIDMSCEQSEKSYFQGISVKDQQIDMQPKSRLPKSAANLQMIHGGASVIPISVSSSSRGQPLASSSRTKEQAYNLEPDTNKQQNIQLNWLSNYNTSISNVPSELTPASWPTSLSRIGESEKHDKINDPTLQSTSVRNLMLQQLPSSAKNTSASVHLLKHIADQTKDNNWTTSQPQKSVLEPECILSSTKSLPHVVSNQAKQVENVKTVRSSIVPKKLPKQLMQTSRKRLYVPPIDSSPSNKRKKTVSEPKFNLNDIIIEDGETREVLISERHYILDRLMSNENKNNSKSAMPEPDEIFINRSKRVMSLIDTMVERKKRKRFERISSRAEPKTNSLEDQFAESEEEWSSDESQDHIGFIKTQLPLEEIETEEKRNYLQCVDLVSRRDRNRLLIEQCEEKVKIFSPLCLSDSQEVSEDFKRFYDTILKTGGTDVQLRIDTNIKRNDLPLIEGLNRNTSRMKMNYMTSLGLEKRSKRTTLYKVKPSENSTTSLPKSIDLNKVKPTITERPKVEPVEMSKQIMKDCRNGASVIPFKFNFVSCREALKPPNKDEYMKSLGLMAS